MKLAVMQPYIFPYIGYFQLVKAVDVFVFYDDVNYIKGGWVNRNRLLLNGKDHLFTLTCIKASPNKLINEIEFDPNNPANLKIIKTIEQAYKKAPYFEAVLPLVRSILSYPTHSLPVLGRQSVVQIAKYLSINTEFKVSSECFSASQGMDRSERLVSICKTENAAEYINPIGGKELYNKAFFKERDINLHFLETNADLHYKQYENDFVPFLSIIDVLMFNSIDETNKMLDQYHFSLT